MGSTATECRLLQKTAQLLRLILFQYFRFYWNKEKKNQTKLFLNKRWKWCVLGDMIVLSIRRRFKKLTNLIYLDFCISFSMSLLYTKCHIISGDKKLCNKYIYFGEFYDNNPGTHTFSYNPNGKTISNCSEVWNENRSSCNEVTAAILRSKMFHSYVLCYLYT